MITELLTGMKKGMITCMTATAIVAFGPNLLAQQSKNAIQIGTAKSFAHRFSEEGSLNARGSAISIQTTETTLPLIINSYTAEGIRGGIQGSPNSTIFFDFKNNSVEGKVILLAEKKAYNYYTDAKGNVFVEQVDINKVVCVDMYISPMEPAAEEAKRNKLVSDPIPALESLPGESAVMYLDFDGQIVTSPKWNSGQTINADPANLTTSQMMNTWYVVSEDYRPFKVNVTTKESVYNAAPKNKRMRCVITPTNTAAPGTGGIAYVGSFTAGDDNTPCWVYNLGGDGQTTGETCSHELGHTVGLEHDGKNDGTEYYPGHNGWAPIMGVSYGKTVTQWSKGEYNDANNQEEDVKVIATSNGFTYRTDEAGNIIGTAAALKIESNNSTILAANNYGVISTDADVDVYSFKSGAGNITLNVKSAESFPDLDIALKVTDGSGNVLATSNPSENMSAIINATIPSPGTYYLHVDGAGTGDPVTGYSDYASIGEYTIGGTVIAMATGVTENAKNNASIYPNPASDKISVSLANPGVTSTINVVNMIGQTLHTVQTDQQSVQIDLSTYNKGIYFITVSNASGTSTSRFIKE